MSRRDRKKQKKREKRRYTSLAATPLVGWELKKRRDWPLIACYVPDPDIWKISGCGSVFVLRENPGGGIASACFCIDLMNGGLIGVFGADSHPTLEDSEELRRMVVESCPPMVPGPLDDAVRCVYGAYALSLQCGYVVTGEEWQQRLYLLPPMPGTRNWWLEQLTDDGLTPPRLMSIVRKFAPDIWELPEGKEFMCLTTARFAVSNPTAALSQLRRGRPDFEHNGVDHDGTECFSFTREYPEDHDSPLAALGGRQVIGEVRVRDSTLWATARALSMSARLVMALKQLLGPDAMTLQDTEWKAMDELLG